MENFVTEYETDTQRVLQTIFVLQGYESLQEAFATEPGTKNEEEARDWCEQLVIARFMQLMRVTHLTARERELKWAAMPIYFTEHAYDFIVRSEV